MRQMRQMLSLVTVKVENLLIELNEKVGLADIKIDSFKASDEEELLFEDVTYKNIPVHIIQHRAILSENSKLIVLPSDRER